MDLINAKPVNTPGWKEEIEEGTPLEGAERTEYRAISARINYLAQDRPDIQFQAKEICRFMQNPTSSDWNKIKKLGKYLRGRMRVVYRFRWQEKPMTITGYTDTNWAGCTRTRRSTSAGGIVFGSHLLRSYSKTQATIALSSAEAELAGIVKMSAEILGLAAMMKDVGITLEAKALVYADASAALGIVQRKAQETSAT